MQNSTLCRGVTAVLLLIISEHQSVCMDPLLGQLIEWNVVPTDIYHGLLTNSSSVVKTSLVNGICFQYNLHNSRNTRYNRCQYYRDCCAMTPARPLEQLAPNTFSCHNGFYVVDKCPSTTENSKVRNLCESTVNMSGEYNAKS